MSKVKNVTIITCVVLSSIVVFSASALAAPAIVQSDSALNFNDVKLQQLLTDISNKEPSLNVVFYSNNTFSPNTVLLPNNTKVNKAVYSNDNFIGTIKKPNYISLWYNKDSDNPNKGSFSVNVGSDFRPLISKEEISNNIVKPNISRYLPQDPESFIPMVAEQVVVQIRSKQQQIATEIENKQAWDNTMKAILFGLIIVLLFAIVYYLVKAVVNKLTSDLKNYNEWQEIFNNANINYSKLLGQSTYLMGYTGATGKKAELLLTWANELNDKYLALKTFPSFINELMYNETWIDYTTDLVNFSNSLNSLLEQIDAFLKSIGGLSGTDPLAEKIKLQELQDKQNKLNRLVNTFNQQYQDGSKFLPNSLVHSLNSKLITCLNSDESIDSKIDFYEDSLEFINKEVILINKLYALKDSVRRAADYIVNNDNTYYHNLNPITTENKQWAQSLLIRSSNHNDYFDVKPIERIKEELEFFAIEYKQQDAQYENTNEIKSNLIKKVNFTVPTKFVLIQDRLLREIREVTINSDYKKTEEVLERLESEINSLIKDVNSYKSRQNKLSKYSGTRKSELTKELDKNNYTNFDHLIIKYDKEDKEDNTTSYSSSSKPSSSSSYRSTSSYSNSSYSSSSPSSSWSSSSSDSSWSSPSTNDDSSSSSSSDNTWSSSSSDDSW